MLDLYIISKSARSTTYLLSNVSITTVRWCKDPGKNLIGKSAQTTPKRRDPSPSKAERKPLDDGSIPKLTMVPKSTYDIALPVGKRSPSTLKILDRREERVRTTIHDEGQTEMIANSGMPTGN